MFLHALAGVIAAAHPSGVACGALFRVAGNQRLQPMAKTHQRPL